MESAGPDTAPPQVVILGVPVHAVTFAGLLDAVSTWIARGDRTYQVCTASPEFVMIAQDNAAFRQVLRQADLCVADGVGLLLAARFLGHRLPERVTGSDGLPLIAERAAQAGWSLFLLGAAPGVAEQAAANLTRRFPGLRIAGTYAGGYVLFALKSAAPELTIGEIFSASWPFVWLLVLGIAILALFPPIVTFLPSLM